jgi:hypothetical protein
VIGLHCLPASQIERFFCFWWEPRFVSDMLRGVAHKHAAALALAALAACMLGGWRLRSGRGDELVGPTPAQFAAQLQAGALSQAGYLTDSEHPAGLIASEAQVLQDGLALH